jgi:hypothetical protein
LFVVVWRVLDRVRNCSSQDQVARLGNDISSYNGSVRAAVNNRLPLIEGMY